MSYILISNEPQKDYESALTDFLEYLKNRKVKGLVLSALTDDPEERCITAHWNVDVYDLGEIAQNIQFEAIDNFLRANIYRYLDEEEEESDE